MENDEKNLEAVFQDMFQQGGNGTGDEELLKIASNYSRQMSSRQIKGLAMLRFITKFAPDWIAPSLDEFVKSWIEMKQWNNSAMFVMRALDSISLKKFLGENAIKVNVEK